MTREMGGRGPELTQPLLEGIQSPDQRGKKKGREAPVKRRKTMQCVCRGLLGALAGPCQICKYRTPSGFCHSSEKSAQRRRVAEVPRQGHGDAGSAAVVVMDTCAQLEV